MGTEWKCAKRRKEMEFEISWAEGKWKFIWMGIGFVYWEHFLVKFIVDCKTSNLIVLLNIFLLNF